MKNTLGLCLLLFAATAAPARWPVDPAENLTLCSRTGEQGLAKVAGTSDGGCYISWQDNSSGNYDTYLQRLDADGEPQWGDCGIAVSTHPQDSWITDYDLAVDHEDHAIVAINDIRDGGDRDITAYRIASDGTFVWGADGIAISANEGFEPDTRICVTTEGNVVFAWQEDYVLHLRKLSPAGADLWDPATITLTHTSALSIPRLAAGLDDSVLLQFLVAQGSQSWSPKHLCLQRFNSAGEMAWEGLGAWVSTAGGFGPQMRPDLLSDGEGGAWCYWYDSRDSQLHAYAGHMLADGSSAWGDGGVRLSTTTGELQMDPKAVHVESDTGFDELELYYRITNLDQGLAGIAGQRLSSAGARLWGDGGLLLHPLSNQERNSVRAVRMADTTLVCHLEFPVGDFMNSLLVAEAVTAEGQPGWNPSLSTLCSTPSQKVHLAVGVTAAGQLVAAWRDHRSDASGDLLLQNVNPDGSLGPWEQTDLAPPSPRPSSPLMLSAWPNPFNPVTTLAFNLPAAGPVRLSLYDVGGAERAHLLDETLPAGRHQFTVAADGLPSGLYLARLTAGDRQAVTRLLLIR